MEPLTIGAIVAGISALVGVTTIWFRIRGQIEKEVKAAISAGDNELKADLELRILALEIEQSNMKETTVRREDFAEVKADIKALKRSMDEMRELILRLSNH